ncbi:hypothetical protein O6H91_10G041700 [Diphasiastrum complanatum]|uniref:Uncharacterized protein n=2 Tax=Diphasiastrum complanatum TaxID=34168 RepID=A0ACC2CGB5_DIPCM|nr:hypothetical protein O6H91_24G007000 [Diphasiastrum complanatum]KAJ7541021.1 hypothetical protein O6H91_10G041700 [Diphasiastrum complanatum]
MMEQGSRPQIRSLRPRTRAHQGTSPWIRSAGHQDGSLRISQRAIGIQYGPGLKYTGQRTRDRSDSGHRRDLRELEGGKRELAGSHHRERERELFTAKRHMRPNKYISSMIIINKQLLDK